MYTLNDEQISSLENFIGKIPESLIKSKIQKWYDDIGEDGRVDSDKMERFVEFQVHLPAGLQYFPLSFALAVKNTPETEKREAGGEGNVPANLIATVDESIVGISDAEGSVGEDVEETEHTLGKQKGPRKQKKIVPKKNVKKK